jgi:hypothetical protein
MTVTMTVQEVPKSAARGLYAGWYGWLAWLLLPLMMIAMTVFSQNTLLKILKTYFSLWTCAVLMTLCVQACSAWHLSRHPFRQP